MDPNSNTNPNPAPEPNAPPTPEPTQAPSSEPAPAPTPAPEQNNGMATPSATPAQQPATPEAAPAPAAPVPGPAPAAAAAPVVPPTKKQKAPKAPKGEKKGSKKIVIISIIALVVITLVLLGVFLIPKLFKSDYAKTADKIFSENIYIPVKDGDKYGYIDLKGNMKIPAQFTRAYDFQGNYATVMPGDSKKTYALIDRKGEVQLEFDYSSSAKYYEESDLWLVAGVLYDDKLNRITPEGRKVHEYTGEGYFVVGKDDWGISGDFELYNKKAKSVYQFHSEYLTLETSSSQSILGEAYCALRLEEYKTVVVNCDNGKEIATFDSRFSDDYYAGFTTRNEKGDYGYVLFANGKVVFESDSSRIDLSLKGTGKNLYYKILDRSTDEVQYYDIKRDKLSSEAPESDSSDSDLTSWEIETDSVIMSCKGGYGLLSGKTQVIPCEYDQIYTPDLVTYEYLKSKGKNYIIARKDDTSYILNAKNGKAVQSFNTKQLRFNTLSSFVGSRDADDSDNYIVYNLATKKMATFKADDVDFYPMYIKVRNEDGAYEYYNKNLKLFYTEKK